MSYYSAINDEISYFEKDQIDSLNQIDLHKLELRRVNGKYLHEADKSELIQVKEKLNFNRIAVSAIDSPIGKVKHTYDNFNLIKKYMKIALFLDSPFIRVFSDVCGNNVDRNIGELNCLAELCDKRSIGLLLENEVDTTFNNYKMMKKYIESLNDNVYILFDVCNYYIENDEYLDTFERLYNYISYMHIRNYSKDKAKFVALNEGDINYYKISSMLKERKYQGGISLESHLTIDLENELKKEKFTEAVKCMKKIFE